MKAIIRFKPSCGYGSQFYTPVLNPTVSPTVRMVESGWLDVLRGGTFDTQNLRKAEIEGGWDAKRFSFVLETGVESPHMERKVFLFGYTEPCNELTDSTKLYFSRLTEIHVAKYRHGPDKIKNVSRNIRDLLIFPKQNDHSAEVKYNAKIGSVFQRIASNHVFGGHIGSLHDRKVVNMTGSMRNYNCQCAPVSDISAEGWTAGAVVALLRAKQHNVGDPFEDEKEIIYHIAGDMVEDSVLAHVDVWDEMTAKSNLGYDGYIGLGELKAIMEDPTAIIVNSRIPSDTPMGGESAESKALFDFFVKQAVAEAKYNGLGFYQKSWERRGGEVVQTVHNAQPLAVGSKWDNLEHYEQLAEAGAGTSPLRITMPAASIPFLLYGDVWKVDIRIDLSGDIVGVVRHGVDEDTSVFVRPAWAVAMTSGLLVSEQEIEDICNTVELLNSERDRVMQFKDPE